MCAGTFVEVVVAGDFRYVAWYSTSHSWGSVTKVKTRSHSFPKGFCLSSNSDIRGTLLPLLVFNRNMSVTMIHRSRPKLMDHGRKGNLTMTVPVSLNEGVLDP